MVTYLDRDGTIPDIAIAIVCALLFPVEEWLRRRVRVLWIYLGCCSKLSPSVTDCRCRAENRIMRIDLLRHLHAQAVWVAYSILIGAAALRGQVSTGSIAGQVTDPARAIMPSVTVMLTNEGKERALTKDYFFPGKFDSIG